MTYPTAKYLPGQRVFAYSGTFKITEAGCLDAGKFWYRARRFEYDRKQNTVTWRSFYMVLEEDIEFTIADVIPENAVNYYPKV